MWGQPPFDELRAGSGCPANRGEHIMQILETPRLILREFHPEDVDALCLILSEGDHALLSQTIRPPRSRRVDRP